MNTNKLKKNAVSMSIVASTIAVIIHFVISMSSATSGGWSNQEMIEMIVIILSFPINPGLGISLLLGAIGIYTSVAIFYYPLFVVAVYSINAMYYQFLFILYHTYRTRINSAS